MIRRTHTRFDFGALARSYDRWYETAEGKAHDHQQKAAVSRLLPPPTRNATLLDVGCGTGHWSRFFGSLGYRVVGVDLSREMLCRARSHDRIHGLFGIADGCSLPFDDFAFDVVSAMAVVEFTSCVDALVAEVFRCARTDGTVIVGTLNRLAPLNRHRVAAGKEPYCAARLFSPTELRHLLAPFGTVRVVVAKSGANDDERGAFILAMATKGVRPRCVEEMTAKTC